MNVLFEEDGAFRAGTILADNTTSLQVELASGKRSKVKAANVVLRYAAPAPGELLQKAEAEAEGIDVDFLWEVCGEAEFGFEDLAADYQGGKPDAIQAAAVLLRLHSAPMYFHRKGKGRFRKAPPEILQAALAGLEKKKQQAAAIERMAAQLAGGELPEALRPLLAELLYKPDRNKLETKALEAACAETGQSAPRLLRDCGALASTHDYHLGRFLFEYFPESKGGTGFPGFAPTAFSSAQRPTGLPLPREGGWGEGPHLSPQGAPGASPPREGGWGEGPHLSPQGAPGASLPREGGWGEGPHPSPQGAPGAPLPREGGRGEGPQVGEAAGEVLPLAAVRAFSIDDATTTEIDDAFSVTPLAGGGWRVGIHIAAPGLGFGPDSDLGRIARGRLSTVYMPGRKITMLPESVVDDFTLAAGREVPAVSLYLDVVADYRVLGQETRLERVPVVANLRHHDIEPVFNAETLASGLGEFAWSDELLMLWELAQVLEAGRGKPSDNATRKDYAFTVDWDGMPRGGAGEAGVVTIAERPRGSPLDVLVAELMIVANSTWGALLRDAGIPALYRVQTAGKVRMSTVAAAHEGLGVDCYAWSSSPLRRYCDLANQWQLIACLRGEPPPFPPKSAELLAALRDFELTYAAYAEFQRGMERYWCLRWLLQEAGTALPARVIKEQLVRLEAIPLVIRLLDLPGLEVAARGARVRVAIERIDLLEADIRARFVELLPQGGSDAALPADGDDEAAD